MHTFEYTIINQTNQIYGGIIKAFTERGALRKIGGADITVVSLTRAKRAEDASLLSLKYISSSDRIIILRTIGSLLKAGLPLIEALHSAREHSSNPTVRRVLAAIQNSVYGGQSFSQALSRHPKFFSPLVVAMIEVGERGGRLQEALDFLVNQMESDYRLKRKIRSALLYPSFIILTMIGMVSLMILFVIPKVTAIYTESDVAVPIVTRALIVVSDFAAQYYFYIFAIFGAILYGYLEVLHRSKRVRAAVDGFMLGLPMLGVVIKKYNLVLITRSLNMLLSAGVPIDRSLQLAAQVTRHTGYRTALLRAESLVKRGVRLSDILRGEATLFLPLSYKMIVTGEQSGKLDEMLAQTAQYYDDDLAQWSNNFSALIEPILLLTVGAVVGLVAVAVMFPLWNLAEVI